MYSSIGRRLFHAGRQLRDKLCKDTNKSIGTVACAVNAAAHGTPVNYVLGRSYCNKNNSESSPSVPTLLSPDAEAEIKLKQFLSVPENERMQKIIELEIEVMRQNNERVPDELKPRHWVELVRLDSRSKRKRYLSFIWAIEKKRENAQKTKAEKLKQHLEKSNDAPEGGTIYKLGENAMFLRFYDTTINHMWHNRLMNRMLYGQQLVLDCGYEKHMNPRELRDCAKQLQFSFAANRIHDDPFDLYFCNANFQGELMKHLNRFIPPLYNVDFPLNVKSESYTSIFKKENLIYLTPHCQQEMTEFDHDAVYIIGALVDKSFNDPLSMAKAKREGIRMLKFPLDRYLQWGSSSGKNLTLNQVINILLDLRKTGSWDEALKHVPRRKLHDSRNHRQMRRLEYDSRFGGSNDNETVGDDRSGQFKPNDRYVNKIDRSYKKASNRNYDSTATRDNESRPNRDFSMKARQKFRTNLKD